MKLVVFGLSITSSWGNGHATVYRGLLKALARRGVESVFVEKDAPWYAENRDMPSASFAKVRLYSDSSGLDALLEDECRNADVVLMGSYFPDGLLLADRLARLVGPVRLYYDIDTPITLASFQSVGRAEYVAPSQLSTFDAVLSFTGGGALRELEDRWGARKAVAFYCGLDPDVHHPGDGDEELRNRLGYMGTYSADRQAPLTELLLRPAMRLPEHSFLVAGPQYPSTEWPSNVRRIEHLPPSRHAAFYNSSDFVLNITREAMRRYGYCPSVRLFEAAGCAACIVSDRWAGMDEVFSVGHEIIVVDTEDEMVALLRTMSREEAHQFGERALGRALREHTYDARAGQLFELLDRI